MSTPRHPAGSMSLAVRLSRALTLAVAAAWLVGTGFVAWHVDRQIQHNFDVELVESAHRQLYPALLDVRAAPPAAPSASEEEEGWPRVMGEIQTDANAEPLFLQLRDAEGRVLLRSQATPASPFAVPLSAGFHDTPEFRVFSLWDPQNRVWLQLADTLEERQEARERTLFGLLAVLVVMLPVMAGLIYWLARRELRSVQRLQGQIQDRSGSNLQPLDLALMPGELHAVGEGVNQLLARLGEALNVERALAANAAHELRTPLAEVRLRLRTALDRAAPHPVGTAAQGDATSVPAAEVGAALQALETLSHRTERLLQLSRAEGADVAHFAPVHLGQLAEQVAQAFWQQPAARKRLDCLPVNEHASPAELTVQGDIDSLAIVLRNLIENALHHTAGAVELEVCPGARPVLVVRDAGSGLPAPQLALVQRRHVRGAGQHIGYGLGMSIVQTIAHKHGAELQMLSPPPGRGQGLEVRLVFPPAAAS